MPHYIIGLDFGTTNTKACISTSQEAPNKPVHQFMRWKNEEEPYLFPSRVFLMSDGTLQYGKKTTGNAEEEYGLFKMAVAEDQEFRTTTALGNTKLYDVQQYDPFTPELLSIFFITNALLEIKEKFKPQPQVNQGPRRGLFGRLLGRSQAPEAPPMATYAINLGIPTELSNAGLTANVERRRKFETILAFAHELMAKYPTQFDFSTAKSDDLKAQVTEIQKQYNNQLVVEKLNKCQTRVVPESFAGLYSLIQAGKLSKGGYYVALDIGGGSSDVSFFKYGNATQHFHYYSAQSYMIGTSVLYAYLAQRNDIVFKSVKEIQKLVHKEAEGFRKTDRVYKHAFHAFFNAQPLWNNASTISDRIRTLFMGTVHSQFLPGQALGDNSFKSGKCLAFGGGALLPWPDGIDKVTIHDNGLPFDGITQIPISNISDFAPTQNMADDNNWEDMFCVLAISYDLSHNSNQMGLDWYFNQGPNPNGRSGLNGNPPKTPHPFNEGYYIYDTVQTRAWIQAES